MYMYIMESMKLTSDITSKIPEGLGHGKKEPGGLLLHIIPVLPSYIHEEIFIASK